MKSRHFAASIEEEDSSVEILGSSPCPRKDQSSHTEQLPKSSEVEAGVKNKRRKVAAVKGKNVPQSETTRSKPRTDEDGGDLRPGQSRKGKNKLKTNCDNDQSWTEYLRALEEAENPIEAAKMLKPAGPSFTMLIRSCHHHRGYIPSKFANRLNFSRSVKLQVQVPGGSVHWVKAVGRGNSGGGMNMGTGFVDFVRDNNLEEVDDVIVFEMIEPEFAKLKAWIFHASSFQHGQGRRGTGCSMERPSSSSDEPEQEEGTKIYYSYRFHSSAAHASPGTKRALKAARKLKSDNLRFILILNASAFINRRLYAPAGFCAAIYLSRYPIYIEVQDSNGRQWSFLSTPEVKGGSYLTEGWTDFITENDLKQGDVCMFELIESRTVVLKVSAFHVEEEAEA